MAIGAPIGGRIASCSNSPETPMIPAMIPAGRRGYYYSVS
jgi:hypothetical protein